MPCLARKCKYSDTQRDRDKNESVVYGIEDNRSRGVGSHGGINTALSRPYVRYG